MDVLGAEEKRFGLYNPDSIFLFGRRLELSRIRLLTACRSALAMFISALPIFLNFKYLEPSFVVMFGIVVSVTLPSAHRIGATMEQVKIMLASGLLGWIFSAPFQKVVWLNNSTPWIGVGVLVIVGFFGSIFVSWLDPKMSSLPILRLGLLFIALSVTFAPTLTAAAPHWNPALQILLCHIMAAATGLFFGMLTPFVTTQINGDFSSIAHDCAILFDNMADQLKLTKQDSLETDPSLLDISEEHNLIEFDTLRREEEKKVRILEKRMARRMKVIKQILGEAQMELWTDAQLVHNHDAIYKDLDRLLKDFIQMRIALETGFIPRLSFLLIQPLLPRIGELRATIHEYITFIESSLIYMFDASHRPKVNKEASALRNFTYAVPPADKSPHTMHSKQEAGNISSSSSSENMGSLDEKTVPLSPLVRRPTMIESETLALSKLISTITQGIAKTYIETIQKMMETMEVKLSPTAELTRLNFFLWRITELRKRLKSLEHSVNFQVRHARTLGWWWYIRTTLFAVLVPFISLFQGILSVAYMALAMLVRTFLWIVHPCCCRTVRWEDIPIFGGRAKPAPTASVSEEPKTPRHTGSFILDPERVKYLSELEITSGDENAKEVVLELPEPTLSQMGHYRVGMNMKLSDTFFADWIRNGGWKFPVRFAIALALSSSLALAVQLYWVHQGRAAWACVTVLIVFGPNLGATIKRAAHRVAGTILGAFCALLTVYLGKYTHPYMVFFCLLLFVFFVTYAQNSHYKPRPYSWTVANFTYIIILLLSWPFNDSAANYAILTGYRLLQVLIGTFLVYICSYIFPDHSTDKLYAQLLAQSQKATHAFIEMIALTNSAIQETGKIGNLVSQTNDLILPVAELLKLAKAELRFIDEKQRTTLINVVAQMELIANTLLQMNDTLKAGFTHAIRDWIVPYMDLMTRCVLFIEEDALLVYSFLTTRKRSFRPEPTRIPSILREMDELYLKLRKNNPHLADMYPEAFRWNAFTHTTREFVVAFSNLVYYVTEPEQHNQLIHLYSR